jgi:mRNA interferase MazF
VLVCLLTSTLRDAPFFRLSVMPGPENGLRAPSQVMVDKIVAVRRDRCGSTIGRLDAGDLVALNRLLALVIGLADPASQSGN